MAPTRFDAGDLATVLPPGGLTLVSSCSAELQLLADTVMRAGGALGAMTFSGVFVPGLNRQTWFAGADCRVLTFFMTPELRALGGRVEFLPLCYQDILRLYRDRKPAAALFMCSPPDAEGRCSFGAEVAFIAELWREIPTRIAHINPLMPRTPGDPGIPAKAGAISRIVGPGRGLGPVSLSRMDVDVVVTEHGAADLRARDYRARAEALIAIAPPNHRRALDESWAAYSATL